MENLKGSMAAYERRDRKQRIKASRLRMFDMAKALSKRMTEAEIKLLDRLRRDEMKALGWFNAQSVICGFIVDFYCKRARLVIEVDGGSHHSKDARRKDAARDACLRDADIRVLRFSNERVLYDIEGVAEAIRAEIQK